MQLFCVLKSHGRCQIRDISLYTRDSIYYLGQGRAELKAGCPALISTATLMLDVVLVNQVVYEQSFSLAAAEQSYQVPI